MKKMLLLPGYFKIVGLLLLPVSLWVLISEVEFSWLDTKKPPEGSISMMFSNFNLTDEFAMTGVILGLCFIAFAKLKREDEYIRDIRLKSLNLSVYLNYFYVLLLIWTAYGANFVTNIYVHTVTLLLLYIIIFNFNIYIKPKLVKS